MRDHTYLLDVPQLSSKDSNNLTPTQWEPSYKYRWEYSDLDLFRESLFDENSLSYLMSIFDHISMLDPVSDVATSFNLFIKYAIDRVCPLIPSKPTLNPPKTSWFDDECKYLRARAINQPNDNAAVTKYRQVTQRRKRNLKVSNRSIDLLNLLA